MVQMAEVLRRLMPLSLQPLQVKVHYQGKQGLKHGLADYQLLASFYPFASYD